MAADAVLGRGYKFLHLVDANVNTDEVVSACPGILHTLTVNKSPTTSGTLTLYDGVSNAGTIIGIISLTQAAGTAFVPTTLEYDLALATGLYVAVASLAGFDFTVTYV